MKVVSIINYKGGVGKTTLTANLGAYAAMRGYRVLLIDLDPQTQLTFSFVDVETWKAKYKEKKTLKRYFDSCIDSKGESVKLSSLVIPQKCCRNLGLISSNLELTDMDMLLAGSCGASSTYLLAGNSLRMYNYLNNGMEELMDQFDLVLIDCPPNCNAMVRNAIIASDYYLIPARMDYLSSLGIENLERNVLHFLSEYNEDFVKARPDLKYKTVKIKALGVVPMMVDFAFGKMLTLHREYMEKLSREGRLKLKDNSIPKTYHVFPYLRYNATVFSSSSVEKGPVVLTEKKYSDKLYEKTALYKVVHDLYGIGEEFLVNVKLQGK